MQREIDQHEFDRLLDYLAQQKPIVKTVLNRFGSYDKLPDHIKSLIDKDLHVKRVQQMFVEED